LKEKQVQAKVTRTCGWLQIASLFNWKSGWKTNSDGIFLCSMIEPSTFYSLHLAGANIGISSSPILFYTQKLETHAFQFNSKQMSGLALQAKLFGNL
jgi:hypothetical protein